ncbi:MAG: hypothetical protein ACQSGP_08360 [Frankia sp.]
MTTNAHPADECEVNLSLGTPVREMIGALTGLPADATLTDFYGDADLLLVITPTGME